MAILEISITPVGTGETSYSSYVSNAIDIIRRNNLNYQVTPTSTVIEGDINKLLDVAKQIHCVPFDNGATRTITNILIDERRDKTDNMTKRVQEVQ